MISTKNLDSLPNRNKLQSICRAISVLDAILSQEWEFRYYSYNNKWSDDEEFCEMRDGSGDHMLILFREDGCVINGVAHEYELQDKRKLSEGLPTIYDEFIFGEPVNSRGTTFCIWSTKDEKWETGQIKNYDDGSEEMLRIFDGNPQTYFDWATEYFEDDCIESGISFETVTQIYNGQPLTKKMVLSIVNELEDWSQLEADLVEIGYPYNFN